MIAFEDGLPHLEIVRRTLACGLDVIIHRDESVPQVCASVWYRAGSSDESAERTGLAHLFEHLFKNSQHLPAHHYDVLRRAGALEANASTSADRTAYYEVVPANELGLALWLESDRMGYFEPGLDGARLAVQQSVVRVERRKRYESVPYGAEQLAIARGLYPPGHPHRHLTIGLHEHIQAATRDEIIAWYRTWYVPANATLVIAGDVELAAADDLVDRYFGSFPGSTRPPRREVAPVVLAGPVREQVVDPHAVLIRIHRAWHGPPAFAEDAAALDVVAAAWCTAGTGALWRRLVYETQLAQRVAAWTSAGRLGGELHVAVDLHSGADPEAVRAILEEECARAPDPAGIARVVARREAAAIWSLVSVGRRAQLLQHYALYTEDPDGLARDLRRFRTISVRACEAAIARWIDPARGVEVTTVPALAGAGSTAPS
jgi:predicted Zn-dependent peptidase